MSYAYPRNAGASSPPSFMPDSYTQSQSFVIRIWDRLTFAVQQLAAEGVAAVEEARASGRSDIRAVMTLVSRRIFTVVNAAILLWVFTLRWGERTVFQEHIDSCIWESWERWVRRL